MLLPVPSQIGRRGGRALLLRDGFGVVHRRHAVQRADLFFAPWPRFAAANAAGALARATTIATLATLAGPTGSVFLVAAGLGLGAASFALAIVRGALFGRQSG
jgi:membrane protein DedA with SNARE-associated domain